MGKIRRSRQKLHLQAVKPSNLKDKEDVLKANEVDIILLLHVITFKCRL